MTPSLAFAFAAVPDPQTVWHGLEVGSLAAIAAIVIAGGALLHKYRSFRKDTAKEIKLEMQAAAEALRVEIQQPLTIKPHVEYTPLSEHQKLAGEVDQRLAAMSRATAEGREKIYNLIRENNSDTQHRLTEIERSLNNRIDAMPQRLIGVLSETKKIHQ